MACNPDVLSQELFILAKGNFNKSIFCKLFVYLLGTTALFFNDSYSVFPIVTSLAVVTSEFFQYRSDNFRRNAESLRRKLDFYASFGWAVSVAEVSDILARVPANVVNKAESGSRGNYFDGETAPGPIKAYENLEQSSWYSKHLAETAFNYCTLIVVVIVTGSLVALYAAFNAHVSGPDIPKISKMFTSTVMIIFSIGLIRMCLGYKRFKDRSDRIEGLALGIEKSKDATEIGAVKLWSEYHIARAGSPLIPEIIWKMNERKLNELYKTYRNYK